MFYSVGAIALLASLANGQATSAVGSVSSGAPTADLGYVKYQGYTNATAGIDYFRGIQYGDLLCVPSETSC